MPRNRLKKRSLAISDFDDVSSPHISKFLFYQSVLAIHKYPNPRSRFALHQTVDRARYQGWCLVEGNGIADRRGKKPSGGADA
jgi:hypothetical protein